MRGERNISPQVVDLSVILPVYRNADTVLELHRRLLRVLEQTALSFEVIFVDDACPQDSLALLEPLSRTDPRVGILALVENVGQQQAVMAGLAYAQGQFAVILDADLQDPPEAIPDLINKLQEGYAIVFAGRRGRYEPVHRLVTSRLFKFMLHLVCGVPADAGAYMAISRQTLEQILAFYAPKPFIVAMVGCTGLPMVSIPVKREARPGGRSAYSSWRRFQTGWLALFWAIRWKYPFCWKRTPQLMTGFQFKAVYGKRFTPTTEHEETHG